MTIAMDHPDKMYFPAADVQKDELVRYYERIAPLMLPHITDRPLMLHRFPEGVEGHGFFQKRAPDYFPDYIERIPIEHSDGMKLYASASTSEALQYLASHGSIEIHIWLSRKQHIRRPDQLVLDLDPQSEGQFGLVQQGAALAKGMLERMGARPLVKATGSRGLHVVVPLRPEAEFAEVRRLAKHIGKVISEARPEEFTIETKKERRGDRVLIDYWRIGYAQTQVAPYSVRARETPSVAAPVPWGTALDPEFRSDGITIADVERMLEENPWDGGWENPPTLRELLERL